MARQTDGRQMDGQRDGWPDRQTARQTDGQTDGWAERRIESLCVVLTNDRHAAWVDDTATHGRENRMIVRRNHE